MAKFYVIDIGTGETVDEAEALSTAIRRAKTYLKEEENVTELMVAKANTLVRMSFEEEVQ